MSEFNTPPPGGGCDQALVNKISSLEQLCTTMQNEIALLRVENNALKQKYAIENQSAAVLIDQYTTDEEEVAKETNWIVAGRKSKKRKAESSPEVNEISNLENSKEKQKSEPRKTPKPPPIMVSGITDYKSFYEYIKNEAKSEFTVKILNNDVYKVNATTSDDYRVITKNLNSQEISWYSYENKHLRPIKVVVKNLHHSWSSNEIVSDLKRQHLKVISAVNILQHKTKKPLDIFTLSFDNSEDINKIYEIRTILNTVVKLEPTKKSKLIPQCKSCQSFGHTHNYCSKPPRCVKCSGKHNSKDCQKSEKDAPKCFNCGEPHPASYRGCIVAKELQKMHKLKQMPKSFNHLSARKNNGAGSTAKTQNNFNTTSNPKVSYSSVVKNNINSKSENTKILEQILEKLQVQENFNSELNTRLSKLENIIKNTNQSKRIA